MPELPEVEVVRAGLEPAVSDALITGVQVLDARSLKRHQGPAEEFPTRLEGRRILGAMRRGKFLWLPLADAGGDGQDSSEALLLHLGMSGQALLRSGDADAERHLRVRLELRHPEHGELAVHFVDQRIFGSLAVDRVQPLDAPAGHSGAGAGPWLLQLPGQVAHIGRDPLDPHFDQRAVIVRMRRRSSAIKRVLLDQGLLSGIGNIYADEALWAASLHPEQPADRISPGRLSALLEAVRQVLGKALAEGGTSFDAQYVNVNGQAGYFAHSLNAYGRHGQLCPRCGTLIQRMVFMNRSSHFCPKCQRLR